MDVHRAQGHEDTHGVVDPGVGVDDDLAHAGRQQRQYTEAAPQTAADRVVRLSQTQQIDL